MKTVKEIMISNPKSCSKLEPLHKVVKEMSDSKIGTMPVVDRDQKVIGIITDRDICLTIGRTNKHISDLKVHEAMTHEAHTCQPDDKPEKVFDIMRAQKVARLPVIDGEGRLRGIISLKTVIRQLHTTQEKNNIEYASREKALNSIYPGYGQNNVISPYDYEHFGYNEHWGE